MICRNFWSVRIVVLPPPDQLMQVASLTKNNTNFGIGNSNFNVTKCSVKRISRFVGNIIMRMSFHCEFCFIFRKRSAVTGRTRWSPSQKRTF